MASYVMSLVFFMVLLFYARTYRTACFDGNMFHTWWTSGVLVKSLLALSHS